MTSLPFETDQRTGILFLRLPEPHSNIILTPPLISDVHAIIPILNDPRVYPFLGAPLPHLEEHAINFVNRIRQDTDEALKAIMDEQPPPFEQSPVRTVREIKPDGNWEYIGDCGFGRWRGAEIQDETERSALVVENARKAIGDPTILWSCGCKFLSLYILNPPPNNRIVQQTTSSLVIMGEVS
jgi:hypothetical protein